MVRETWMRPRTVALLAASLLMAAGCSSGLDKLGAAHDGGAAGTDSGGTGGTAGTSGAAGTSGSGGSAGALLTCEGGAVVDCAGKCIDLATSGANCGVCGHDCGGGKCDKGVCQPMVVVDNLTKPVFDVDATELYYGDSAGNTILACPKGGCALQPKQLAQTGALYASDAAGILMISGKNFAFVADQASHVARPTLFVCDVEGCSPSPSYVFYGGLIVPAGSYAASGQDWYWVIGTSLSHENCTDGTCSTGAAEIMFDFGTSLDTIALGTDGTNVYFVSPSATTATAADALESCPMTGTCKPTVLYSAAHGVEATSVYGKQIYMLLPGGQGGYPNGVIETCPTSGACTPVKFIDKQPHPTLMTVDSSGVYWFDYDPAPGGAPSQIVTCPLSGCQGGPRTLATNQTGTLVLHTDDKFVYWATHTQILRVAK